MTKKLEGLVSIHNKMWQCEKCFDRDEKYCIMGNGNPEAKVVITGMTPSKHRVPGEHKRSRKSFGHRSWDAFKLFLEKAGIEDYFAMNVASCIKPHKDVGDMTACRPWYFKRLKVIFPIITILMGKKTGRVVRGKKVDVLDTFKRQNLQFIVSYHPMSMVYDPDFRSRYVEVAEKVGEKVNQLKGKKRLEDFS